LPQNQTLGTIYLGIRTTMPAGLFQAKVGNNYTPSGQGSISLRLVSVEGTGADAGGKFTTWKSESFGTTVFSFDSTDGISSADEIPTIPVSSHTHYNWALTKPGLYRVTLEATGKLMPTHGSAITSARKTFLFAVPFSSRLGHGSQIRFAAREGVPELITADPDNGVAYAADQALLEATTPAASASSALPGAQWEMAGKLSAMAAAFANGVGILPAEASAGLLPSEWSGLGWTLQEVRGPGDFVLISEGGIIADGAGDSIPIIAGSEKPVIAAFSATGIYRITGILSGTRFGTPVSSKPITLVFGAGLTAEYDYAAWQSSFERTAGLAPGTLGGQLADYDHDGLPNGVEFAFFWQGLDPTRPDGYLMPQAFPSSEGFGEIHFLRDTFKDPLDESAWQIRPSISTDLVNWNVRSSRNPGFPLGIFETGGEEGNALGRILKRRVRMMPAVQPRAFFRFQVTSP
jgi:surface-anchored protein